MFQDEKVAEIPLKKKELRRLILEDPKKAWETCKQDKYYAIVRRSVLEELEHNKETKNNPNVKKFRETIDDYLEKIDYFGLGLRDELGDILLADLIIDKWRTEHDAFPIYTMSTSFTALVDKLLETASDPMLEKILKQSLKSMRDLEAHEKKLAEEYLPLANRFAQLIHSNVLPELSKEFNEKQVIEFLYAFLLSNAVLRDYTMKQLAIKSLDYTLNVFKDQDQETKYKLALYPQAFKLYSNMPTPHLHEKQENEDINKEEAKQ